jgi:hypothetical protein
MRFLKLVGWVLLGLVGLVTIAVLLDETGPQLEVRRVDNSFNDDGQGLEVTNIGTGPITIKTVHVNERAECLVAPFPFRAVDFPMTLPVGEKVTLMGNCRTIRTTIVTDKKSVTYSLR